MVTGTVKWFNATKGFGFITPDEGGKDAFVHISEVERSGLGGLAEGQRVNFNIKQEPRGLKAVDLATVENDHATTVVMHWYVNEQVEEEATADTLYHQVKMVESSPHGLLMIDRELAGRPAPVAEAGAEA